MSDTNMVLKNVGLLAELMYNKPVDRHSLLYTNWCETRVAFGSFWYGTTEWHPDEQLFIKVFDYEKVEYRDFAVKDFVL